jgi:hypothetical protein
MRTPWTRITIIAVALLGLAGCSEPAECRRADMATYADAVATQISAFRRQSDLVAATPRIGMATPLQRLLDIQTATRAIAPPGCLAEYHTRLGRTMNLY